MIEIHGFATSNNFKVLVSLAYKGLPHTFHEIDPGDREATMRISGQILTPVMAHGQTALFDSAAIMRYLDANFRETPRLYGTDRASTWAIERWERLARGVLAEPMMDVVTVRLAGEEPGAELLSDASARLASIGAELVAALDGREWLVGESMTAADVAIGCVLHRIRVGEIFPWPASLDALVPWIARVAGYLPERFR